MILGWINLPEENTAVTLKSLLLSLPLTGLAKFTVTGTFVEPLTVPHDSNNTLSGSCAFVGRSVRGMGKKYADSVIDGGVVELKTVSGNRTTLGKPFKRGYKQGCSHVCRSAGRLEEGRDNGAAGRQRLGGTGETAGAWRR
jgi:hypothetical protein